MTWSFSLVTLFYNAFPLNLQDVIVKDGYHFPNLSIFLAKSLQALALQNLREHAVVTHKNLADESKRIKKLLSTHLPPRSHSTLVSSENYHYSNSQAELTIAKHSDPVPSVYSSSKPLVVKKDGQNYPQNPTNGYISRYPFNFFGFLSCCAVEHIFKECQHNRVSTVRS